jgi:glycosyltransferase involved in cell wall biosynthesis
MKILVGVIAYNEEKNLPGTLQDLADHNFGYDVVLIDNGSTDSTRRVAEKFGVPCLSHCINSGSPYGTVSTYFMYAYYHGYDIVCQFDGDGQHLASELKKIVAPVVGNEADFVIGSRFLSEGGFKSYFFRRIGIRIFSFINSAIVKKRITDTTSGFKAYGARVIEYFAHHYRKELFDLNQILLLSHYSGARIMEVPVVMKERVHGTSEFDLFNSIAFVLKGFVNIFGCVLQKKIKVRLDDGI